MQENKPVLIVGLGNPGAQYAMTRHNVGFMAADHLAGAGATWKKEKNALTTHINANGQKVIIAKPQTFMNNSGNSVRELMTFYKVPMDNLIVIHDEMDLPVGAFRDKVGGGSAGHNGIKSIDANVGKEYFRMRIGVGHPRELGLNMVPADWVLGKFNADELKKINQVISELKLID